MSGMLLPPRTHSGPLPSLAILALSWRHFACLASSVFALLDSGTALQVHDSPLKVAVEHLRDQPYNPSEDNLKATTLEIVSTLKELLHLHPLYNEQLRSFAGVHADTMLPCHSWAPTEC